MSVHEAVFGVIAAILIGRLIAAIIIWGHGGSREH
jgi:hypothetical protein